MAALTAPESSMGFWDQIVNSFADATLLVDNRISCWIESPALAVLGRGNALAQGQGALRDGPLLVCAAAEELPFASGSFDLVTTTLSLRHWQDPSRGVRELVRVLSPEGVVVVADADFHEEDVRRRRWFRQARGGQLALLLGRWSLRVIDYRLAAVRGPVPCIHVLVARRVAPRSTAAEPTARLS